MPSARGFSNYLEKRYHNSSTHKNFKIVNKYRLVSFLPICSKIVEKLIFDSIYEFFDKNNLLTSTTTNQDSDLKTLVYISLLLLNNIVIAFDANPSLEVCGIFLDLSKASDRVWHDGLL